MLPRRSFLHIYAAAACCMALTTGCANGSTPADAEEDDNLGFAGIVLGEPLAKPTIPFTDTEGQPFDFAAETEGQLTLLFFGYTSCPDVCPVHLSIVAKALEATDGPARDANVVFVGVDTARDTPEVMRTFLDARDADFVGLTATPADLDQALPELLLPPIDIPAPNPDGTYAVGHPSQIVVFSPDNTAHIMYPFGTTQEDWVTDLPRLATYDWPVTTR